MQGWCGKLSYERKLKLRVQTQLPTTVRTNFSRKTINTYIYLKNFTSNEQQMYRHAGVQWK